MIYVEESKEEEKTLMLSSALADLIVDSKGVEKISTKTGVEHKDEQDVTEIWDERQMSGNGEGNQKKWLKLLQI